MNQKRCAIYLRVSTLDQNTSIQSSDLFAYIESRGWSLSKVYEDKITGTHTNRKMFKELQEDARKRRFDVILVWKLDRMFRSIKDCLNGLHEFNDLGVEFVSLKDSGIDMTTPSGKLLLHILAAFSEFEASIIRERVRAGVKAKIAKTGTWGPKRKRNDLEISILRAKGCTIREIARRQKVSATSVMRSIKGVPGTPFKDRS